ncbi:MAG: glycosyltransferase family 4 protein [Phycisphaerae bacterium]|nr:glycosyltransferase family 4 protein [Phycisphaerae bacterium]MCZ2399754.1 glycosyltransferase family 4 protein [Phycisphaerae bacterium]
MRVCHVITRLIVGGAQENTLLTCAGLHERGHEVTLISGPTRGPEGSLADKARNAGYRFIELPELVRAVSPWLDARAQRELTSLFSRLRPDVVHTHSSKAGILGRFAAHRARVPLVVHTIHGMSFNRTQPGPVQMLYALLEWAAARRTHAIITVADALREQSVAARIAPRDKFETIYSGMPVEQFTPTRYDRDGTRAAWNIAPRDDVVVVGTVARLFRRKGYEQLLPIMSRAAGLDPRLRFVWVGDGAQRAEYEQELSRRGLRERTFLTGLVAPDEIPRILAGFDILAHTSQWEGLPRAVVQALLMQTPAVAFALDGTPEVVLDGRTGRLIRNGDAEAFAAALAALARDPDTRRRLGAAGRQWCLDRFDARRMVDRIEALYERLAARPRA